MVRLEWTKSGYMLVDAEKQSPNKKACKPEVVMVGGSPPTTEHHHRGLPIPLVSLPFILFCVFMLGVGLGMGIA